MSQEVFHQTMSLNFFSHIKFIVKKFLFQFQKSPERGTHSSAMPISVIMIIAFIKLVHTKLDLFFIDILNDIFCVHSNVACHTW
jgi:hypothetical protein